MKKFYIVDKNGTYASADGKTRFKCLTGKALFDYLKSDEGSKKEFDIDFDDNGDEIGIEIPKDIANAHLKEKERRKYVLKTQKTLGYTIVSLNSDFEGKDGEMMTFGEVITDDSDDLVEEIARKENIQRLQLALLQLSTEELDLITSLYLIESPLTEAEYAARMNVNQSTINRRKNAILHRLKSFF